MIVVRVIDGVVAAGHEDPADGRGAGLRTLEQVGVFSPKAVVVDELGVGEVGFLVANIKKISRREDRRHDHRDARGRRSEPFPASRN